MCSWLLVFFLSFWPLKLLLVLCSIDFSLFCSYPYRAGRIPAPKVPIADDQSFWLGTLLYSALLTFPFVAAIPPEQKAYLAEVHQKVEHFLESEALSTLMTLSVCCSYPSRAGGLPGRGVPEGGTEALSTLMTLSLCCSYPSRAGGLPGRGAPEGGTLPRIRGPLYSHDPLPLLQLSLQRRRPSWQRCTRRWNAS